jgi:membrane fusion protein (multidrug efflux system)
LRQLAVLVLALLGLAAPAAGEPPGVLVAEAALLPFPLTLEGLGTARANEAVEIRPQTSEVITAIHFSGGEHVAAEQVLITLDDTEVRASVAAARAALVESQAQLGRAQELAKTSALARSELERRLAVRDADRAALDAAESRLADTVVRAPFAGRVGLRRVSRGSLVTPATVITTLDDTDVIKLDFDVPETGLARLEEGLAVEARSAAWPDTTFRGEVASIDTRVDPVSRSLTVRALVPNPDGQLRPGMLLSVVLLREDVLALMVPEQALVPDQSRQFVLVVGSDGVVAEREVRTGRRRPGEVEILEGLSEGERVVAEGTQHAAPGAPVRVMGTLGGWPAARTEAP